MRQPVLQWLVSTAGLHNRQGDQIRDVGFIQWNIKIIITHTNLQNVIQI